MQGQICNILRSQLDMNCFLPHWPHRFPHFGYIYLGGVGVGGGALILGRCRAFDLFASVDAHLWTDGGGGEGSPLHLLPPVWQAGTVGCRRLCAQDSTSPTVLPMSLSPSPPFSVSQQAGQGLIKNIRTICAEQG